MELQTRKLVERGKRIGQRELGLSEHEALSVLRRQSQQGMKAIILSAEVRQSMAADGIKRARWPSGKGKDPHPPHIGGSAPPRASKCYCEAAGLRARTLEQPGAIRVEFDSGGQQFGSMEATGSHAATPSVKCSWQHCKITT